MAAPSLFGPGLHDALQMVKVDSEVNDDKSHGKAGRRRNARHLSVPMSRKGAKSF